MDDNRTSFEPPATVLRRALALVVTGDRVAAMVEFAMTVSISVLMLVVDVSVSLCALNELFLVHNAAVDVRPMGDDGDHAWPTEFPTKHQHKARIGIDWVNFMATRDV